MTMIAVFFRGVVSGEESLSQHAYKRRAHGSITMAVEPITMLVFHFIPRKADRCLLCCKVLGSVPVPTLIQGHIKGIGSGIVEYRFWAAFTTIRPLLPGPRPRVSHI